LEQKQIQAVSRVKQYGLVFDKWVVDVVTKTSCRYGYERNGNEVDLFVRFVNTFKGVTSLGRHTRPGCNQGI